MPEEHNIRRFSNGFDIKYVYSYMYVQKKVFNYSQDNLYIVLIIIRITMM